jgi:hypothetical protein
VKDLTRFQDWEDRLSTYLDRVRDDEFYWGKHDCVLFANAAVKAITGEDFVSQYQDAYASPREAAELLRELKFGTLHKAVTKTLGNPEHVAQATTGDVVEYRKALGICVGRWSYFVGEQNGKEGLVFHPTLQCSHAWKIAPYRSEAV